MKICLTDNSLMLNLNFRGDIVKKFLKKGYQVTIIAPRDENISIKKFDKRLKFIPLEVSRRGKNPFADLKYCKKLYDIYRKEKFDIIFLYTIKPNIYGNIAAKLSKIKSVSIIPGLGHLFIEETLSTKIVEILYKIALNFASEIWFLNQEDKNEFLKRKLLKKNKSYILPGEGINLQKFKPIDSYRKKEKITFLMIARILWEKGFKEYVEAAEIIKNNYKNVEFQILGAIDEKNPSGVPKEIVISYHNKNIINYLGVTNNVSNIIANCDCLVLPSYREGMPRTLLEGAAMGKPLIATNVTGCKEIIKDKVNGFLCKEKDGNDLAKKMEKIILLNQEKLIEMGRKGREIVEKEYDIKLVEEYYIKFIEKSFIKK